MFLKNTSPLKRSIILLFKRVVALLVLCMLAGEGLSQSLWKTVVRWIESTPEVDTCLIYSRPAHLSVELNSTMQNFTVGIGTDYSTRETADSSLQRANSTMDFSGGLKNSIGIGVGYGNLCLGYGLDVSRREQKKNKTFSLGFRGHKLGIGLNYYRLKNYAHSWTTVGEEGSAVYKHWERVSHNPCDVYRWSVDGYWSPNNRRFAYTAAYKSDMVQQHSAGGLLLGGSFLLSGMDCDASDQMFYSSGIKNYVFYQASLVAGYSYNWVLYHRDGYDAGREGMRNLTLNATVLPLLSIYNRIDLTPVVGGDAIKLGCPVSPDINACAAISYTYGRLFVSLQCSYSMLYFRSPSDLTPARVLLEERPIEEVSFHTTVQDWGVKVMGVWNF